jgi:PiT family inorganic phosphate transporter
LLASRFARQQTQHHFCDHRYAEGDLGSEFYVPLCVVLSCQTAMALGTYLGGWRIVRTMGSRITRLNPMQGFCAEMGGAITLFMATWLGIPVSSLMGGRRE